ncbi:MAG: family 43 glycosylhydrolase [Lachnospiraceae bacterium]|nr:family 43 glycosylhydrolase [Lachnospiraceae bacterium]
MKQGKRVSKIVLSGLLALSMIITGMTGTASEAKAKKATLKTKKVNLKVNETKKIKIKNKKKSCKYTFKSNKKKVASVTKKGKIKAKTAGTAKITVKEVSKKKKGKARKVGVVKVQVTNKTNNNTGGTDNKASATPSSGSQTAQPSNTPGNTGNTPTPSPEGVSVKVYTDEISDANLIAKADGVGTHPTPTPTPFTGEPTPVPTPQVLFNATMENGDTAPITKRGDASVSVAEGGANNTAKCAAVTGRKSDWHGAMIDITKMTVTGDNYELKFYAKQSTGADSKIDLSMEYVDADSGDTKYDGIKAFDLPNDTWTECKASFTVPNHVGDISIYWQSVYNSNNFMDFYLDEVSMQGIAKSAEDESTPDLSAGLVKGKVGNPIVTSRLTADPWAMEYNGRVYVYGTNDSQQYALAPERKNNYDKINTLNCYSSADMVNWTDHGTINVKGAAKWSSNSWAPAVAHKTINGKEKFFLYFANNASSIGVLTADSPVGPWTDPIGKPIIDRSIENCGVKDVEWLFDPAVLVDDDGQGYLYFGGFGSSDDRTSEYNRNPKCARVIKLEADMVSTTGAAVTIDAPYMFEDSGINKINGKYYYSYCTNWTDEARGDSKVGAATIAVMESDNPMTGFKYVGSVMKNPGTYFSGADGNNHHCFAEFNGKFYAFYHTKRDTIRLGTKADFRTTYVNELKLGDNGNFTNADGSIALTAMTTSGAPAVATINPYETVEAETFAMADTVGTVENTLKNSNEDWATNYSVFNGKLGGYIGITEVDFGTEGASELTMKLGETGSDEYKDMTVTLNKKLTGKHTIYFEFGKCGVLMDSWCFKK